MSTPNPFLLATKTNLRFGTSRGHLTTEDLWTLSLPDLDRLAVALDEKISSNPKKSFITETVKVDASDELRLVILKAVIEDKLEARKTAKTKADAAAQRALLTELIEKKKLNALGDLSLEELEKKLAATTAE